MSILPVCGEQKQVNKKRQLLAWWLELPNGTAWHGWLGVLCGSGSLDYGRLKAGNDTPVGSEDTQHVATFEENGAVAGFRNSHWDCGSLKQAGSHCHEWCS